MDKKDYKMVDISDIVSIPVPKGLTAEEEAEYIIQHKAKYMANFEEEYEELKNMVEGRVPMIRLSTDEDVERFLSELFEEGDQDEEQADQDKKDSA